MADRWWVNDDADGDWNNANNWSTTEGGAGGAGVPTSSDNALFSDTSSSDDCALSANSVCGNLYTGSADTGGTDNYSGTIDIATFNLTNSGVTKIANGATLKIGTSADTGLTTNGLTFNSGSTGDFQAMSKINNSGDLTVHDSQIWLYKYRAVYTQTADGNISTPHSANKFRSFTINAGVTLTMTSVCKITGASSDTTTINGTLAIGSNLVTIGCSTSGSIVCGASADITGGGTLIFYSLDGTFTNTKTNAFSFSGSVKNILSCSTTTFAIPAWDFSNANVTIQGGCIDGRTRILSNGTLKCKNFSVIPNDSHSMTIDLASHNPSFEISGDVLIDESNATVTWNKGTGTITLTGGDADIDFASKEVEDILINATGTKTFTEDVKPDSLSTVAGAVDFNGKTYTMSESLTFGQNCTITGLEGSTFIVDGNFTASGAGIGSELDLTAASEWILTVSGLGSAQYVDVSYSNASGGSTIHAADSIDSGNTQNWDFTAAPVTPQGLRAIHRRPLPQLLIYSDGLW